MGCYNKARASSSQILWSLSLRGIITITYALLDCTSPRIHTGIHQTATWFYSAPPHVLVCVPGCVTTFPLTSYCAFWTWNTVHTLKWAMGELLQGEGVRKERGRGKKKRVCQGTHSFRWAPSGSWRLINNDVSRIPSTFYSLNRQTLTTMPKRHPQRSCATRQALSGIGSYQSLARYWAEAFSKQREGERTKMEGSCKRQWENTNEMMAWSHPFIQPIPILLNLVKSAAKSKQSPQVGWQRKEWDGQSNSKQKLDTDYYSLGNSASFKQRVNLHSVSLQEKLEGSVNLLLLLVLNSSPSFLGIQYITVAVEIFITPYGEIVLVVSQR